MPSSYRYCVLNISNFIHGCIALMCNPYIQGPMLYESNSAAVFASFFLFSFFRLVGTDKPVWILGDSLVLWGEKYATRLGCPHLGLNRTLRWWGKRGLNLASFQEFLDEIGNLPKKELCQIIGRCLSLRSVKAALPNTFLIWSDIIPRVRYHNAPLRDQSKIDKTRRSVNKYARSLESRLGGSGLRHFDIQHTRLTLFREDGTHLTDAGNSVLIIGFREALSSVGLL